MKKIRAVLWALCIAAVMLLPAAAAENYVVIDPDRTDCSIELTLTYKDAKNKEQKMNGGSLGIYTVATVRIDNGADQSFDIAGGKFAGQSVAADIPSMSSEDLARENSRIAAALAGAAEALSADQTASIKSGKASFDGLKPGLYLIMQEKKSDKDVSINPFLISIPDGNGSFNIEASPKVGITVPPEKTPPPPELPQTGQLWWPVALMAGAGIVLVLFGIIRRTLH